MACCIVPVKGLHSLMVCWPKTNFHWGSVTCNFLTSKNEVTYNSSMSRGGGVLRAERLIQKNRVEWFISFWTISVTQTSLLPTNTLSLNQIMNLDAPECTVPFPTFKVYPSLTNCVKKWWSSGNRKITIRKRVHWLTKGGGLDDSGLKKWGRFDGA